MAIRVVLADDHTIVRDGLKLLLEKEAGFEIVAEVGDGRSAIRAAREHAPDVVIMDVAMPDLNGIEATRQLVSERSGVRVLALSMHSDRRFVVEMLRAGARGYLLKDCAQEELSRAVATVADGSTYLSPSISDVVVRDYIERLGAAGGDPMADLSGREREVLQLLAEGCSTRDIATALHVSNKTVETHRQQLMRKLDLHSVAELTKFAVREGLTGL
jgi:DNA-binding NarL/FixJ family response regulator